MKENRRNLSGVIEGDLLIDAPTEIAAETEVIGTLTVQAGAVLTLKRGVPLKVKNALIEGDLEVPGKEIPFKPGHVVGPGTTGPDDIPGPCLLVEEKLTFGVHSKGVLGRAAVVNAGRCDIFGQIRADGMFMAGLMVLHDGAALILRGSWADGTQLVMLDHASLDLSEAEICILEADNSLGEGYYAHTGYGVTVVGQDVRIKGDDSFIWLWLGTVVGKFAEVTGNSFVKTDREVLGNPEDMANINISEFATDTDAGHVYHMKWQEKDAAFSYTNTKQATVTAVLHNRVQQKFPMDFLFDYGPIIFVFRRDRIRAGNILIHQVPDVKTLTAFADAAVFTEETK